MISAVRTGSLSGCRLLWVLLLAWLFHASVALADPSWAGGPATTVQRFDFTTNDETLAPDAATNPLGVAAAEVNAVIPPGSGWQDPSGEFVTAGINGGDGAWDLGPGGWIEVNVPVSPVPPAGLSYDIEFHIEAIVYQGPVQRPGLTIAGHGIEGFQETAVLVEQDPPFGGYYRVTWTGTVAEAAAENLAFVVAATSFGALVDSIEIHTRYSLNKAPATVTLSNLERLYDGSPKAATVTTDPPGLTVITTYDGSPTAPTETGSYAVVATIDDPVYAGSASGVLQIANESQTITFASIGDQVATASVNLSATGGASGNPVVFSVTAGPATVGAGNVLTFSGAGSVSVTATQAGNANYLPAAPVTRTFEVTKAMATVSLNSLAQTYDGGPRLAGATTTPAGLAVDFLYDGAPGVPVNAGTYAVVASINEPLYQGTASGTLVVAKASQAISFPAIGNQLANASVNLSATGGGSGNPVTYEIDFGPAEIGPGNVLTFTGAGPVSITASQAGGVNHLPAAEVTRSFVVSKAAATVVPGNLAQTYDGAPRAATATTTPAGLGLVFTYDGSSTVPTGAGSYEVVATIDDPIYMGSATGTLVVAKAAQTITFAPIANQAANATVNLSATGGGSTSPVVFAVVSGPAVLGGGGALTFSGPGEVQIEASQAGDANHLAADPVIRTFQVTKAMATVTLDSLTQTYDGDPKPVGAVTVPAGLSVDITYEGDPAAPSEAGSYAVAATINDAIYQGTAIGTLVIEKAVQTITFNVIPDQIATSTVNLAATGGASGNPVTFAVTSGPATIGAGNVLSFTGAGAVTITASQAGDDNYLAAMPVVRSFTVTKAAATIQVAGLNQTYDGNPKPVTTTTTPAGLTVITTYDGDPGAPVEAGGYAVEATINDPLYQGAVVRALTIAKATQTITFAPIPNQLATASVNLSATGGGSGNGVTFEVTTGPAVIGAGNVLTFTGAGAVSVTASQAGDANHLPAADVTRTFTVAKAAAAVVLGNLVQTYDGTPRSAGATTTPSMLNVTFTYNGSPVAPTDAGSYGVVATIQDPVYEGTASGSFVIEKAPQTIDFPAIADQLTTGSVNLAATGGGSGNAVTFAVTGGPATIGAGNVLTFTGAGSVSITASQTGNANYLPAMPVVRTFSVTKASATVTLGGLSHTYDGTGKQATATTVPAGLGVVFTYNGAAAAPVAAGSHAVVATIDDPIYQGTASGTLVIGKAAQTISFAPIADQLANASVNLTATGGASGNAVTFAVTAGPGVIGAGNVLTFTGAGNVTITASQAEGPNHLAAPDVPRTFAVSKAPATVALAGLAQTYDGSPKVITATTTPAGLDVVFSYDGAPAPPVNAGTYPVEGVIDDPIYSGTAAGSLVIGKASQSIDFPAIPDQVVSSVVNLSATGGASGNPVTFAVTAGPGSISGGNVLTFSTAGSVTVTASQAGGPNHLAAMDVVRTFAVDFSGYDAWRDVEYPGETDPAVIGFTAAPFGQALPNGFRYYLGNGENDAAILTLSGQTGADWVYRHPRVEPARSDVGASYEWSTDLEHWQDGGESRGGVTVDFTTSAGAPDASGIVSVEVRATPSGVAVDRLFVRLKLVFPFVATP